MTEAEKKQAGKAGGHFTPVPEWVMARSDLTQLEKLIVCRVIRWGNNGCWESTATLARVLGANPRSIQRAVKRLARPKTKGGKDWLIVCYETAQRRRIYISPVRLSAGCLFEPTASDRKLTASDRKNLRPQTVQQYIKRIKESLVKMVVDKFTIRKKPMSEAKFQKRKNELMRSLFDKK